MDSVCNFYGFLGSILSYLSTSIGKNCRAQRKIVKIYNLLLKLFRKVCTLKSTPLRSNVIEQCISLFSASTVAEKKVLQTMVQKASSGGKSTDLSKNSTSRKNVSTSTEGLGNGLCTLFKKSEAYFGCLNSYICIFGKPQIKSFKFNL